MARPFVDRIEGKDAVLIVDGSERRVRLDTLPAGVTEGVYLSEDLSEIDRASAGQVADEIEARRERLKQDDGDDFAL